MNWTLPWRKGAPAASRWFERIQSARINETLDREYTAWMAVDMQNQDDYATRELTWELTGELQGREVLKTLLQDVDVLLARQPGGSVSISDRLWSFGRHRWAAAVLPLVAIAAIWVVVSLRQPPVFAYQTAVGEQQSVTLPDQSTIVLNTATKLRVVYSRSVRTIELEAGEAIFTVTHNDGRPFDVIALGGVTRAVGTQFAVEMRAATTEVSVLEGVVTVWSHTTSAKAPPTPVVAGLAVDYTHDGSTSALHSADLGRIRGWQSKKIVFDDLTLAAAIEEYNRYAKTPIVLSDMDLADRKVHGVFNIGDEDTFVRTLEKVLPLRTTRTEHEIVLLAR